MIPYSTQNITFKDRIEVFRALGKPYITQGPQAEKFETAIANFVGAGHAVVTNSATSALHIACLSLGLGPGDILWTSPISFVASANCGLYCGAEVDFVDIDPETFNMSATLLEKKLESALKNEKLPKVLIVVHLGGEPAEMEEISRLASKFGVSIIEDASHAIGSKYLGARVGNGQWSEITVFSFHAVKNMTTGEGGAAVTNDQALSDKMRALRSHGITRNNPSFLMKQEIRTPWHYEQQALGFNYRLTDFQSALGISQLKRLNRGIVARARVVHWYKQNLVGCSQIKFQKTSSNSYSAYHLAIVRVPSAKRRAIMESLKECGYNTNLHYLPIHLQPHYANLLEGEFPHSEQYALEALSLPCHTKLSKRDVGKISSVILRHLT